MEDPSSDRPRSFHVYPRQQFCCLVLCWRSELSIQNHAEFVSIQTVVTLAHNSQVAIRKIDTGHSLVEILGIEAVGPTDALQRALALQDGV